MRNFTFLLGAGIFAIRRTQLLRSKQNVIQEYSQGWEQYAAYLGKSKSLEEWLFIRGFEDAPRFHNMSGVLEYGVFDSGAFYRQVLLDAIQQDFPDATSVTEYGSGLGRNLLFLKQRFSHLECYGYELTAAGVEVAAASSKRFNLPVTFQQLDYARAEPSKFSFPKTDIAFTMFSLEQLPEENSRGLANILERVEQGSLHIEPVPENYPLTYRGIIGRIEHRKAHYIKNFDVNVKRLGLAEITKSVLTTSHNSFMFPSLYVLKKKMAG